MSNFNNNKKKNLVQDKAGRAMLGRREDWISVITGPP